MVTYNTFFDSKIYFMFLGLFMLSIGIRFFINVILTHLLDKHRLCCFTGKPTLLILVYFYNQTKMNYHT